MSTEGLGPILVDQYGGLCTLIDRSDLPVGLSPDCQNVEFFPGGVRSRSGFIVQAAASGTVADLIGFVAPSGERKFLALDAQGTITGGLAEGPLAAVPFSDFAATTTKLGADLRMRGATAFGRSYFGLYGGGDTRFTNAEYRPVNGPFKYDGVTITPVGQERPSASFTVTPSAGGSMSAGRHDFCVVYETASEYVTAPSGPVGSGAFVLGNDCDLASIPTGPGYVIARTIFATPANSTSFFTLPRFTIRDNTTTALTVDFTDAELMSGVSLEDYVDTFCVGPVLGIEKYGSRMVYWGGSERLEPFFDSSAGAPVMVGLRSLAFDGLDLALPVEWVATGAGGSIVTQAGAALQVYQITGDGATAVRGQIDQVALNVATSGTEYVQQGRSYGVRVRARSSASLAQGALTITCRTSNSAVAGTGTQFIAATLLNTYLDTEWQVFNLSSLSSATPPVAGTYVNATVSGTGTMTNGQYIQVDWIELYDLITDKIVSTLWVTPPDDPEAINLSTGAISVAPGDGHGITDVFQLRGNLYVCKEDSIYVTTDNGDDPANWAVDIVSSAVGAVSPHAVAMGDGYALIVAKSGLYYFTGGAPEKISQEIQPTWDAINWGWGIKVWIALDVYAKRAYVGVPTATSKGVDTILVLDFVEGFSDPVESGGRGRKWATWPIEVNAGEIIELSSHRQVLFTSFGTDVRRQSSAAIADAYTTGTIPIVSYYETAPIGSEIGRSLFDRLILRIRGAGSLVTQSRTPGGTLTALTAKTLAAAPDDDIEIKFHNIQTQLGFRVGTTGATDYWSLRRLGAFLKQAPFSYLRKT